MRRRARILALMVIAAALAGCGDRPRQAATQDLADLGAWGRALTARAAQGDLPASDAAAAGDAVTRLSDHGLSALGYRYDEAGPVLVPPAPKESP